MSFKVKVEKVSGLPSENEGVFCFSKKLIFPDNEIGTFAFCISASGEAQDLATVASDVFDLVTSRLMETDGGILAGLGVGAESVSEYLKGKELNVGYGGLVFYKDASYVLREGEQLEIFVHGPDGSGELSIKQGSGRLADRQLLIVATHKFLEIFDAKSYENTGEEALEETIDGLTTEISALPNQSQMGAVFVQVSGEGDKKKDQKSESVESAEVVDRDEKAGAEDNAVDESTQGSEKGEEREEELKVEEVLTPRVEETNSDVDLRQAKRQNILVTFAKAIFREIGRIRHGEFGAVLRLRRNVVVAGIVILVILGVSTGFTVFKNGQKSRDGKIESYLSSANSKFSQGEAIADLNREHARQLFIDAQKDVDQALSLDKRNDKANKLKTDILAKLKETEASQAVHFDTFVEASSNVTGLSLFGKNLIGVLSDKIISVDTSTKKSADIANVSDARSGAFYSNAEFVLSTDKINKVDLQTQKVKSVASANGQDIDVFFGNLYVLKTDQIEKFVPVESGYSGSDYLTAKINFGDRARFAIDKSVWVTAGDKIYKFTRGAKEDFNISGLVSASYSFGAIYTNADIDNLYVVDVLNSALLVIDKNGVYKKVYSAPEFAKVSDVVVDERSGKMYLAVGGKILSAPL